MYGEIYKTYKKVAKDNINRELFNHSNESPDSLIEDIKNNKIVIYTAFTGDYDSLKEPDFIDDNCDYVCFSDNPNLSSDTWKIIPMEESTLDNNRKAKQYKVLPHKYFPDYKYSFWLDGTFKIKGSIREYIYKYIKANSKMLCVIHTERDCLYEEYEASKIIPRYPRAVMEEQVKSYREEGFPEHYGLAVLGAIFREHNDLEVIKLMEGWWDEIIKFTNQDQLSFGYVAWKNDFHPSVSLIYYWDNKYWAKEGKYHHNVVFDTPITSDNLRAKIGTYVNAMGKEDVIELSKEDLYLLINDVKGMAGYRKDTAGRIHFLTNERDKILNSNSLRLTKPLRNLGVFFRNSLSNHYIRTIFHSKIHFKKYLDIYSRIKNLNLINKEEYLKIHPDCVTANYDPILHFIYFSYKSDNILTKKQYINKLFDCYFYIYSNTLDFSEDPILHYVTKGFFEKNPINIKDDGFVKNLEMTLEDQYKLYITNMICKELRHNNYISDSKVLIPYIESNKIFKTDTIRVGVFLEDSFDNMNACPYIRLHAPLKRLSHSKDYHFFVYGKEALPKININKFLNSKVFDIIIVQRVSHYSNLLVKKAKEHNIKIIYETDDDFLDINHSNPSFNYFQSNKEKTTRLIESADEITVSTEELSNRFKDKGYHNINIIKNYYTNDILPIKDIRDEEDNLIKIGYFGTVTHDDDLELIHNVILIVKDRLKESNINVELEVVGATSISKSDWYKTIKLPFYPMSVSTFMEWLSSNIDWDIGIVPLVKNHFNNAKSELKYIEFVALGVPVVASDVITYQEAITDGITGFLANNEEEWVEKLIRLILDKNLRIAMLNNAREDILRNYTLKSRVNQWDALLKRIYKSN